MIDKRFVIVSGKGGVGKSAVAAAIALAAQRDGKRVLAISMAGSGGGLATHLGASPLEFTPTEVSPGLSALVIDRPKALVEYLRVQVGLPAIATLTPIMRAFDALASTAPAVREVITMGKVLWEVKQGQWDLVVADGPPTGQIGSYLRAARSLTEIVAGGRIKDQAEWMEEIMLDASASRLVLATIPEELPTSETLETLSWLDEQRVVADVAVVANRVLPQLEFDRLPNGKAGEAATLHHSLWEEQQQWLAALPPMGTLPFLFGVRTPSEVASLLADELERW